MDKNSVSYNSKIALDKFMNEEWNKSEEEYFENDQKYKLRKEYSEKAGRGNALDKIIYKKFMSSLTEDEKISIIEYDLRKMKKMSLEFLANYGDNLEARHQFILNNALHLNIAKSTGMINS